MNKHTILASKLYLINSLVILIIMILCDIGIIYVVSQTDINESNWFPITLITLAGIINTVVWVWMVGKFGLQFIVIDKDKIISRNLWSVIRTVNWNDVKSVHLERFGYGTGGVFKFKTIVIDDMNPEHITGNGLNVKHSAIKIEYNKRNINIIKKYWSNEIDEIAL